VNIRTKFFAIGIGIVALMGAGGAAYATSTSHDPNVVGGRFCVDYGSNTAHYDWNNLPCNSGQYVDQLTYSQPVLPPVVIPPVNTVTHQENFPVPVTGAVVNNPGMFTLRVPTGSTLVSVIAVYDTSVTPWLSVPFTSVISAGNVVTITYTGTTSAERPAVGNNLLITYTTQG
jgi:hypothetical protein